MLASTILPLGYYLSRSLWGWLKKKIYLPKPSELKEVCLCIPRKSGKTELVRELHSVQEKCLLVDLDELVSSTADLDLCDQIAQAEVSGNLNRLRYLRHIQSTNIIREHRENWLAISDEHKLIYLTSDVNYALSQFSKTQVFACMPSQKLFEQVLVEVPESDKKLARQSRQMYLTHLPRASIHDYNTFEELAMMVKKNFELNNVL